MAAAVLFMGGQSAKQGDGPSLKELELAIADPDAKPATWLQYGQRLFEEKRYAHAAAAYARVLAIDPYERQANLQSALALALAGDADAFHDFMRDLILRDPRLAENIFGRPESQTYLTAPRFVSLVKQAHVQAMD